MTHAARTLDDVRRAALKSVSLPADLDAVDSETRAALDDFARSRAITPDAALVLVRRARRAAITEATSLGRLIAEIRSRSRTVDPADDPDVKAAVATVLERRRLGLANVVSIDPTLDATTDAVVAELVDSRTAERSATRG